MYSKHNHKKFLRKGRKGVVLILTLFFMVILGLMAVALFNMVPQEMRQTMRNQADTQAHYTATSGIKHALAFLRTVGDHTSPLAQNWTPYPYEPMCVPAGNDYAFTRIANPQAEPLALQPAADPNPAVTDSDNSWYPTNIWCIKLQPQKLAIGDWGVDTWVIPDKWTFGGAKTCGSMASPSDPPSGSISSPNAQSRVSAYTIVTCVWRDFNGNGVLDGSESYVLRAKCNVALGSFAKYAYFTNTWDPNTAFTLSMDRSKAVVDGPFHTNTFPQLFASGGASYWSQTLGANQYPSFMGEITYSDNSGANFQGTPKLNYDGLGWVQGNLGGQDQNYRPYDASNSPISSAYNRLIAGGANSIRQVKAITLPTDATSLAANAWGGPQEQALITQQNSLPNETVFVNSQVTDPTKAAGGVFIKGNISQMTLMVLASNGQPIGDDMPNSVTPNATNDGNAAMRIRMSQQYSGVAGSTSYNVSGSTVQSYANSYSQSSASNYQYSYSQSANSNYQYSYSQSANSNYAVSYQASQTSNYTVNYTKTTTVNYKVGASTVSYTGTCTSASSVLTWGVNGQGQSVQSPSNFNVNYSCPKTSNYAGTPTSTQKYTSAKSTTNAYVGMTNTGTTKSVQTYSGMTSSTKSVKTYSGMTSSTKSAQTYSGMAGTMTGTMTFSSATPTATAVMTNFRPESLVVEVNTTPMTLNAAASYSYNGVTTNKMFWSPSASFIINGATTTNLNLPTGLVAVINQDKTNPNFWSVATMTMPSNRLNGVVQVQGNIYGLAGWNKGKKTVAAEPLSWTSPSTASMVAVPGVPANRTNGGQVVINGHLRQYGTPGGYLDPATSAKIVSQYNYSNNLGVLGSNVDIRPDNSWTKGQNNADSQGTTNKDLYIYAVMLAAGGDGHGSLSASNYANQGWGAGPKPYRMRIYGGILQQEMSTLSDGSTKGWRQQFNYDLENASSPPPSFPTMNDFAVYSYLEDRL